jgi:chromosome segregation ATPase
VISTTHSYERRDSVTTSYTARAEHLADTEETGDTLADIAGRCHATGLDPDVYRPVIVATITLGRRPKRGPAWANDVELVETVEDVTDEFRAIAAAVNAFNAEVTQALEQAEHNLAAAQRDLRSARDDDEAASARAAVAEAQRTIADCMEALEILADAGQRLAFVLAKLLAVPDELGDTYAAAYETVRRGHRLPHDGRFIGASA